MSYIRSGSNPDGLYVWHDIDGDVHFLWTREPPFSSGRYDEMVVPFKAFRKLCKKWQYADLDEEVVAKGFKALEGFFYLDTGEKVPLPKPEECFDDPREKGIRVRLSYGDHFVLVWPVTWDYVVQQERQ